MKRVKLTPTLVRNFKCIAGRQQAFLWDSAVPGPAVRATESGYLAYVFQRRHDGRSLRITIGSAEVLRLNEAKDIARELQRQIDGGRDPRTGKKTSVST